MITKSQILNRIELFDQEWVRAYFYKLINRFDGLERPEKVDLMRIITNEFFLSQIEIYSLVGTNLTLFNEIVLLQFEITEFYSDKSIPLF